MTSRCEGGNDVMSIVSGRGAGVEGFRKCNVMRWRRKEGN